MPLHDRPKFGSHQEVPDPIPAHWLLQPGDKRTVRVEEHTDQTVTPVEMAFIVVELKLSGFDSERHLLKLARDRDEFGLSPMDFREIVNSNWGNHMGMVVLKAVLEPERLAPVDLVQSYEIESKYRGHSPYEQEYFEEFADNFGVVIRL